MNINLLISSKFINKLYEHSQANYDNQVIILQPDIKIRFYYFIDHNKI